LESYPLFPFDEDDIRSAFDSSAILEYVPEDTVSLRQFSVILNKLISERLDELDDEFDITQVTEKQTEEYLLRLSREYKRLVANG
jgi:hypothetical protein